MVLKPAISSRSATHSLGTLFHAFWLWKSWKRLGGDRAFSRARRHLSGALEIAGLRFSLGIWNNLTDTIYSSLSDGSCVASVLAFLTILLIFLRLVFGVLFSLLARFHLVLSSFKKQTLFIPSLVSRKRMFPEQFVNFHRNPQLDLLNEDSMIPAGVPYNFEYPWAWFIVVTFLTYLVLNPRGRYIFK